MSLTSEILYIYLGLGFDLLLDIGLISRRLCIILGLGLLVNRMCLFNIKTSKNIKVPKCKRMDDIVAKQVIVIYFHRFCRPRFFVSGTQPTWKNIEGPRSHLEKRDRI